MDLPKSDDGSSRSGKYVLVVEDDLSIFHLLDFHLKEAGYRVGSAARVGEAWRSLLADPADAVVLDIQLPGPFGWELVERMRQDHRFADTPVVMISGAFESEDVNRADTLHAAVIPKPFQGPEIVEKLGELLAVSRRVKTRPTSVWLLLTGYALEGTVHLPPGEARFADAWDGLLRDSRRAIPVTNATVLGPDGEIKKRASFLHVSKSQIQLVAPLEE